jgi:hypothetical protein
MFNILAHTFQPVRIPQYKYPASQDIAVQTNVVGKDIDISVQKTSVGKDIAVQNIQSVRIWQYNIIQSVRIFQCKIFREEGHVSTHDGLFVGFEALQGAAPARPQRPDRNDAGVTASLRR